MIEEELCQVFLHAQLMANKAPEFSGEEEDWVNFSQRWSDFVEFLRATEGREIEDVVLFGILESCVDDATKSKIRSERRREPGLNFSRFWQGLEREFGRDQESAKRGEWERVHLRSGEMTLASWRSYRIAFEAALSQTHGISEREVEQKVLRDLPSGFREKLAREIANKAQEKMWIKVLKSCNLKTQELAVFWAQFCMTSHRKLRKGSMISWSHVILKAFKLKCWSLTGGHWKVEKFSG